MLDDEGEKIEADASEEEGVKIEAEEGGNAGFGGSKDKKVGLDEKKGESTNGGNVGGEASGGRHGLLKDW